MKKILLSAGLVAFLTACGGGGQPASQTGNPFFTEYMTPHGVPPFDQIKVEHYKPAFLQGMDEQKKEIEAILTKRRNRPLKIPSWHWTKAENYFVKYLLSFMA